MKGALYTYLIGAAYIEIYVQRETVQRITVNGREVVFVSEESRHTFEYNGKTYQIERPEESCSLT